MKWLVVVGIILMVVGGALMVKGSFTSRQRHEANVFGAELSITAEDEKPIPRALSATLLVVGAAVTIIGALKARKD